MCQKADDTNGDLSISVTGVTGVCLWGLFGNLTKPRLALARGDLGVHFLPAWRDTIHQSISGVTWVAGSSQPEIYHAE